MKQDKRSFTISLCLEKGPEEGTFTPIQTNEDENNNRTPEDQAEELVSILKTEFSLSEIVKVGSLIDEIRSKLDEIEDVTHIHRIDLDECPF